MKHWFGVFLVGFGLARFVLFGFSRALVDLKRRYSIVWHMAPDDTRDQTITPIFAAVL